MKSSFHRPVGSVTNAFSLGLYGSESVLFEPPIVNCKSCQGATPEEANKCTSKDDPGDRVADGGDEGDACRQEDLEEISDAGGDGAEAVRHQGGEELQHSDEGHHDEDHEGGRHDEPGAGVVAPVGDGVIGDGEADDGEEADLEVDGREGQARAAVLGRHRLFGTRSGARQLR